MRRDVVRHLSAYALAAMAVSLPWPLLLVMAWDHSDGAWALGLTGAARMPPPSPCRGLSGGSVTGYAATAW